MKKIFTVDSVIVGLLSASGYGLGYVIPEALGAGVIVSIICCMAAGIGMETLGDKIVFSKYIQEKKSRRLLVFAVIAAAFFFLYALTMGMFGHSLFEDLAEELIYIVVIPVIGFIISMLIYAFRLYRLRKKYGDGELGFLMDRKDRESIIALNQQNEKISGEYDTDIAVRTANGIFVPEKKKDVLCYLGIPYAKPPVGALRWKAPQAPEPSEEVYEAKHFGPSPYQPDYEGHALRDHRQSEDCLYLNVWTAAGKKEEKAAKNAGKPVLVYLHGGDNVYGGAANPLYYGENFVKSNPDTVFVSFEFRLGILGFCNMAGIPGGEDYPDAANLGILDQIAALEWIRDNIKAFGGDPENVTLMGDSAGGVGICLLAVCDRAKNLFRRAIPLYGAIRMINRQAEKEGQKTVRDFAESFKIRTAAELAAIPEEQLAAYIRRNDRVSAFPVCDGSLIPKDIEKAFSEGKTGDTEFLFGIPQNEIAVYRAIAKKDAYQAYLTEMIQVIKDQAGDERTEELRRLLAPGETMTEENREETEARMVECWFDLGGTISMIEKLRACGKCVRAFYFATETEIRKLGSGTVLMTSTLLGNDDAAELLGTIINKDHQSILQALLVKFLKGEKVSLYQNEINGVNATEWKPYPEVLTVTDREIRSGSNFLGDKQEELLRLIR